MRRQTPPYSNQVLLLLWTVVQPRVPSAVINVGTRLPTGRGMQIKDYVDLFGAAPGHQSVEQLETLRVIALKQAVMQRNPNRIESSSMQQSNILMRNIVLSVLSPECL